jgi:magnesium-transporting ATPase (P-type)
LGTAPLDQVFTGLQASREVGLTSAQVEARLRAHGYNEVAEPERHLALAFLAKFWGLSAWLLELILLVSWILRRYLDLAVVSTLLLVNALVSFVQERRAAGVVAALHRRLSVNARVRRDGAWRLLPARQLVPGDIIRLRAGDFVPADARVFEDVLGVDESALKSGRWRWPGNMCWRHA